MIIYFDTNILTRLRTSDQYTKIFEIINNKSLKYTYVFSQAHILDLKNDPTDEKLKDFGFIESLIGKNYLCKYYNKPVGLYSTSPYEAFKAEVENESLKEFDYSLFENQPQIRKKLDELKETLKTFNISKADLSVLPEAMQSYLKNLAELKSDFSLAKLAKGHINFQEEIERDSSEYKKLRRIIIDNKRLIFNDKNASIKNSNIDQIFFKSSFKKRFLDFIDSTITINISTDEDRIYHRFIMAYNILNSMGIDNEINKKAKFRNTFNDSMHAYYASYCDYLVSDDQGMIEKTKIVYSVFGIVKKVMDPEEFIGEYEIKN